MSKRALGNVLVLFKLVVGGRKKRIGRDGIGGPFKERLNTKRRRIHSLQFLSMH
jgi:hypothetical protein